METRDWTEIRRILEEALELPAVRRHAFVEAACGDEPTMLSEVRSLLAQEEPRETFLESPIRRAVDGIVSEAGAIDALGTRVGPYRLTDVIAVGGMGTVYRAQRADASYDKEVAVKLLAPGPIDPEARRQFERERQLLARLEHANIARLIDGGMTDDGRPYIVMEYVGGVPITHYCTSRSLSLELRLRLFRQVCAAVAHAHRRLIVHRDLKPANILVSDDGTAKLLDFGISRLLPEDRETAASLTITSAGLMTLRYASPEQLRGEPLTTAGDVYSLGVVLYELLTERMPYETGGGLRSAVEAVCEAPVPTPSAVHRQLNREIDAIVLTAIARQAERRYASVEALSDDIERYLAGQAVHAHAPSALYLLRKAARRHRWPVALTATMFLSALGLAVVTVSMNVRLTRQTMLAQNAQRDAERINTFLFETLESADPIHYDTRELSLVQLLGDAQSRLDRLPYQPGVEAPLRHSIGKAYLNLWLVARAEPHLKAAVDLYRTRSADAVSLADALESLGEVCLWRFDYAGAEAAWRESLELRKSRSSHELIAESGRRLAGILAETGRPDEADRLYEESLAACRAQSEDAELCVAETLEALALLRARQGRREDGEKFLKQARGLRRRLFASPHEELAAGLAAAARFHALIDDAETAMRFYRDELTMRESLVGREHPATLEARIAAGFWAQRAGRVDEAEALLRGAAEIADAALPDWHRLIAFAHGRFGDLLFERQRYAEAVPHLQRAYQAMVTMVGPRNSITVQLRHLLASLYDAWGKPEQAEIYRRSDIENRQP